MNLHRWKIRTGQLQRGEWQDGQGGELPWIPPFFTPLGLLFTILSLLILKLLHLSVLTSILFHLATLASWVVYSIRRIAPYHQTLSGGSGATFPHPPAQFVEDLSVQARSNTAQPFSRLSELVWFSAKSFGPLESSDPFSYFSKSSCFSTRLSGSTHPIPSSTEHAVLTHVSTESFLSSSLWSKCFLQSSEVLHGFFISCSHFWHWYILPF